VGFAVSRFGLFLRELSSSQVHLSGVQTGWSVRGGIGLVALGVLVNLSAAARHVQTVHRLAKGEWEPGKVSGTAIALALVLAAAGVALMIYLIEIR
jgi:putative membrane protein